MALALPGIRARRELPAVIANVAVFAGAVVVGPKASVGFVLLACVLALSAALVRRPQRGLLVLAALVPLNGLLIVIPHPSALNGWKEALVVATLLATFAAPSDARAAPASRLPGWAPAVIGLVALALASGLAVGGLQALVGLKVGYFFLLAAVAAWRCPLDARERDRLVTILMVMGVLTAAYGLVQQVLGAERLNAFGYPYNTTIRFAGGSLRSFSTFNQPFGFGFFQMLVLLIGIPQALAEPQRRRNRLFLLALPLLALGLLSSIVRGAWLGAAVGMAYLASHRYRVLLLLVPLAVLAVAFLPSEALSSSSTTERTTSWEQNVGRVFSNPFGVGLGASGAAAEKAAIGTGVRTYQPDNFYFKTVLELGVLGLWMLVLLLAGAFSASRAAAGRLDGRDAALAAGVAAMVAAAAAASFVATYFEIFPMDLFFWLLLTVVARCDRTSR